MRNGGEIVLVVAILAVAVGIIAYNAYGNIQAANAAAIANTPLGALNDFLSGSKDFFSGEV